ncbi:MAG TPA: methyltransferase domain-containing protein [Woeseiaceae bacterium]|nr:methyltransferase domain-containing protein [Woeseiaceae bacterium]
MTKLTDVLACPRCDKTPLENRNGHYHCKACKIDFPAINDLPWLFAEPDASLGEWRSRLHFSLQQMDKELASLAGELEDKGLRPATRARTERYQKARKQHRDNLAALLEPLSVQSLTASVESYLALRTRLPPDQGLNTYYANVHRDWCWGDAENAASLEQIRSVLGDDTRLGKTLVLGAGAGRLAYDIHTALVRELTIAFDFNPMLLLLAQKMAAGETLQMYEFPIAPREQSDDAVLRELSAPAACDENFHLVLGDALRPPFAAGAFDTVVTPWLIDIISEDLPLFARRINLLLKPGGRWINFGSLAFDSTRRSRRYGTEEVVEILLEQGFATPLTTEATIAYMCSPASRHGRKETVFSFAAAKLSNAKKPARYRALPDWIVTGKDAVPLHASFQNQAMTTQIYAFVMSLIDGKRSIEDMAVMFEKQKLMPKAEAIPAIRSFLIKMHDDVKN